MPTQNPRITITLTPALHAQLRRLSELTGNSQSALVAELLEGSTPVFDRLITVLTAAQEAKDSLRQRFASDLDAGQAKLEKQLGLALDTFDTATKGLLEQAEAVKRRSRKGAAGDGGAPRRGAVPAPAARASEGGPTPMSNRGVRLTAKKAKNPSGRRG